MNAPSKHLSHNQLRGLEKIGDVLVPGDTEFPRFSKSGQILHVDRILDYMPEKDTADLKMLLGIFGLLPAGLLAFFWRLIDSSYSWPAWLGATVRLIRIGIRGLVFSLYYSEGKPVDVVGYKVSVYTEDLRG